MAADCCPVGSLPYLASDYAAKGSVVDVGGAEVYLAPAPEGAKSGILMCPDVWGWNGGRVRAVADGLAEQGYMVIVGKFLVTPGMPGTDGDALPPDGQFDMDWIKTFPWETQKPKVDACLKYLAANGIDKMGVMGFCYGGHLSCWASKDLPFPIACGVVCHPSMQLEQFAFGGDLPALLSGIKAPFLFAPAGNDLTTWGEETPNGALLKQSACGADCVWKPYPDMSHGWSCRGDLSDEKVKRDVDLVLKDAISFFAKYLK